MGTHVTIVHPVNKLYSLTTQVYFQLQLAVFGGSVDSIDCADTSQVVSNSSG